MPSPDDEDPRLTGEYVRDGPSTPTGVTLVGVVHDHPASTVRVRRVVQDVEPDVLALELPPAAIPLFEAYADSGQTPPAFGGEMSAAVQAATTDAVVGIDRPTAGYVRRLVGDLRRERPSPSVLRDVLADAAGVAGHAVVCRLAAAVDRWTPARPTVDAPQAHDADRTDPPAVQARDERRRVRQSRSFASAFRTDSRRRAARLVDATREAHMADRLSTLADGRDVVAVVGIDHLDALA